MDKYIIYAHINKINGKIYVGQTKQSLSRRFRKDGEGYIQCSRFWDAIQKYGWDNFEHITLFEELTPEQADLIEEYLINKFDLTNENKGYNVQSGGHGWKALSSEKIIQHNIENWNKGIYDNIKNEVYCVELNYSFESALEAERQTNIDNSSIQKACKGILNYTGFSPKGEPLHWIFEKDKTDKKIQELKFKKEILKGVNIPVFCPELNRTFESTKEAKEVLGIDPSSIRKAIRGVQKTAGKHPVSNQPLHWKEKPELITHKNKMTQEQWDKLFN